MYFVYTFLLSVSFIFNYTVYTRLQESFCLPVGTYRLGFVLLSDDMQIEQRLDRVEHYFDYSCTYYADDHYTPDIVSGRFLAQMFATLYSLLSACIYKNRCLRVWMTSPCGRGATDYSSTPVRQRFSGVRQVAGSIRFPTIQSRSVLTGFFPPTPFGIWGSTSTLDASMRVHVSKTVSDCFAALRQIRSIRRCVPRQVLVSLASTTATLPSRSSTVPHRSAAVRTERCCTAGQSSGGGKFEHVTPLLRDLHWLKVGQRVEFKLAVLVYRCLNGQGPPYLASDLHRVVTASRARTFPLD